MRWAYLGIGFSIGTIAGCRYIKQIHPQHSKTFMILCIIVAIIIAISLEEQTKETSRKVFYLILCIVFHHPIVCIYQYLCTAVVYLGKFVVKIITTILH